MEEPPPGAVGAAAAAWDVKVSSFFFFSFKTDFPLSAQCHELVVFFLGVFFSRVILIIAHSV